jgi:hypothetical protein
MEGTALQDTLDITTLPLVVCFTVALWAEGRKGCWSGVTLWGATMLAPFFLIPGYGRVRNYPSLNNPELQTLSDWARSSTPKDAMFLFPDAGEELYPGIFRAHALRAVYVDWKAGGQVNFLKAFAREWWPRWQRTMGEKFQPSSMGSYTGLGIDYVVVRVANRAPGGNPVFENSHFVAYRMGTGR